MVDARQYNPSIWDDMVQRMTNNYKDVEFYHVAKDDVYDYDRYFVEYTLPDGLRLFKPFDYATTISNSGFFRLDKLPMTKSGKTFKDILNAPQHTASDKESFTELVIELENTNIFDISYGKFGVQGTDKMTAIPNTPEGRKIMTEKSINYNITFTQG